MVRIFEDDNVIHVHGHVNPVSDIETINLELVIADQQTVAKRLANIERDVKRGEKGAIKEKEVLTKILEALDKGLLARSVSLSEDDALIVRSMHLLTMKPILYVLNKKAGGRNLDELGDERFDKLLAYLASLGAHYVVVDAGVEHELSQFEGEEKEMFRGELGVKDDGINNLIRKSYEMLGLMTYFTTGEVETRGWTIHKGSTAPIAGTAIHTDFKDKFIRVEVVFWQDLLNAGSYGSAREKGLVRTEGKEYIVKDGDVMEFKI